jgi:hypothetical protein
MRRTLLRLVAVLPLLTGCATTTGVRYVYQDGDFGVVGIPENTDRWPTRYRSQAESLMREHFPEGHEIIRAEEVVEGSRVVKVEGTNTAAIAPELPSALLAAVKLGRTSSHTRADSVKIKECRIIYRRAMRPALPATEAEPKAATFADQAGLTPTEYHDPNHPERHEPEACEPPTEEPTAALAEAKDEATAPAQAPDE